MRVILECMLYVLLLVFDTSIVSGQDYPSKPIRLVTPPPGGGSDLAARMIVQGLAGSPLKLIIDNRSVVSGSEFVSQAPADGYTLLFAASSFMIGHLLQERPYDPVRDFAPVTLVNIAPNILVVHPSLPVKSVKELIGLARAKPGELNYSSGSMGSSQQLSAELFKIMAGVNVMQIPYNGGGAALNALIGGEVHLLFSGTTQTKPHIKSGRLKALAVTSAQPTPLAPGLPTVAASGLLGYEVIGIDSIFAPAKTPGAILNQLSQEFKRAIYRPEVKEMFFDSGAEAVGSSPEELGNKTKAEITKWDKVIKAARLSQK